MTIGKTMRASALEGFDRPPSVIDVPTPEPGPGEVLVRVRAVSVNAFDTFVSMGMAKDFLPYEFPVVLGSDVSGVVEAVGDGVDGFTSGERVFGTIGAKGVLHDGTFGELAAAQALSLAHTPNDVDDDDAGALGVAGTTAMSAVKAVELAAGTTVLVVGATGGVGTFAVQLAAERGAHVIASARPGDEDFILGLGAADTVDYTGDLEVIIRQRHPGGVDGVIDLVNRDPEVFATLAGLVRRGGRAVSALQGAGDATEIEGVFVSNIAADPDHLPSLASLVAERKVRAAITKRYPLADAPQAIADFTNKHTLGKLLITVP